MGFGNGLVDGVGNYQIVKLGKSQEVSGGPKPNSSNATAIAWLVPLDLMIGRKFELHWIASLEYQYGLVRDDDSYNQWLEARVGYSF